MHKIPLSLLDFEGGSFTKITKHISKYWPLPENKPTFSKLQNILSIALGYSDFHDARKSTGDQYSAKHWDKDYSFLLSRKIFSEIEKLSNEEYIDDNLGSIFKFCDGVPFHHLEFFKQEEPSINVSDEAMHALIDIYRSVITHHSYQGKKQLHSLPACVAFALKNGSAIDVLTNNKSISNVLSAIEFPGKLNALDFVTSELHDIKFKESFDAFYNRSSSASIFNVIDCEGFSHENYYKELSKPDKLSLLHTGCKDILVNEILEKPCSWVFDKGVGSDVLFFNHHNWCMNHPYGFLTGEPDEADDDDEFESSYKEQMQPHYEKAQRAFDFNKNLAKNNKNSTFEIFYVDPDGMDSFEMYNWVFQQKDSEDKITAITCGIAFSPSLKREVTAWNMMDLADTQSGTDCDSVSWSLSEYQKTLSGKNLKCDLYTLPIGNLTSQNPTVIVHRLERSFNNSAPGDGSKCLKLALSHLIAFFESKLNLSVMIAPTQFRNNRIAPQVIKTTKDLCSKKIIKYLEQSFSNLNENGLNKLFLPLGYSDLSD
jgi:hypothetical protein